MRRALPEPHSSAPARPGTCSFMPNGCPYNPGVAATHLAAGGEDRSERTLRAVSDIGQTMVSDADYEQVLAALIERVCELVDAESGGFMLYDPAAGELQL